MPLFENEEVEALKARVKELEAQCASLRHDADSEWGASATEREALRAQLDAANADRARLMALLGVWLSECECAPEDMQPCDLHDGTRAALASTDASAWLRERERAVAERVREACIDILATEGWLGQAMRHVRGLDLDALLGGGE
jgi:hypothetical protein